MTAAGEPVDVGNVEAPAPAPRTRMTRDVAEAIARAINVVVGHYARRVLYVDECDITQRAWIVALESMHNYNSEKGELVPYLATALYRQLGSMVIRDSTPVSAPRSQTYAIYDVPVGSHLDAFAQCDAASATHDPAARVPAIESTEDRPRWVDAVLADHEWHDRVTARLARVVGEDGLEGLVDLLREDDEPPTKIGRPPARLTRSRAVACVRIAQDPELRDMLRERG